MKKRPPLYTLFLFWIILFRLSTASFAQTGGLKGLDRIDSLQKVANALSGTEKVDLLNKIAFDYFGFDNKKALKTINEAHELSSTLKYDKGKSEALVYKGLYERIEGNTDEGIKYLEQGIALAESSGHSRIQGYGLIQLGTLFGARGNNDSAFISYDKAYIVLKDSLHPGALSTLYKGWGLLYIKTFKKDEGWELLIRSLVIREKLKDPLLLSDIYLILADQFVAASNYDEALKYIQKAETLTAASNQEIETIYDLKYQKALILMRQSEYTESLALFHDLKTHYLSYASKQDYVKLLTDIGYTLLDLGNYELSLNNFYEALRIAEENKLEQERAKLFWLIGLVYQNLKQYELAVEFANKSLVLAHQKKYVIEEATSYNLLGLVHQSKEEYDSALIFFNKALVLREQIGDPMRIASTLNNMGSVLENQEKYDKALEYQKRSLKLEIESKNSWGAAATLQALGQLYLKRNEIGNAKTYLDEAERIALKINARHTLFDIYLTQAKLYERLGSLNQSLLYYKRYDQMKDSLYNNSLTNRIASLQNEFMLVQKDQEIELLNKDKALREQQLVTEQSRVRQQQIIIISGLLFLAIVLGGSYVIYKNYKKVSSLNRIVQENNEEIQAQSEELQLSNQMIVQINDGLEQMVEERTNELKQAYKELDTFFYRSSHDFRRPLTTFMGLSEVAKITVTDPQALGLFEKVNETARGLDKMLTKLQSISDVGSTHLIYKEIYFDEVFNSVSDIYREELKEKDIRIATPVEVNSAFTSYPGLIKVIIENLIENSITFSYQHKTIQVRVNSVSDGVSIEIEDAGYGIEQEYHGRVFDMYFRGHERSKGNGLGLYIVKRVVEKLKGTITLTSAVGVGTTIKLFLPNQSQQVVIS